MLSRRGKLNFLLINALIKVNLSLTNYVFLVDSRLSWTIITLLVLPRFVASVLCAWTIH